MNLTPATRTGARNAGLTALYVALVVTFMQISSRYSVTPGTSYLTGFMVLTLFVVSALITGSLILWSPAKLLVDGKKQEAGAMLFASGATLGVLLVVTAVITILVR